MNDTYKKTGACYIRVSTNEQAEYSPESQKKKILEYAMNNNIVIPEEFFFEDIGVSGKSTKNRPEFNKMINIARRKPKPFDVIIVWKYSRFSRNREDSIVYKKFLRKKCNIDVVSVSEDIGDNPASMIFESIIESMDEYYSVNLAEEVRRGMNEKFSRGEAVSQAPFGYIMKDGLFIPDENTAPVVKMIFEWYISGMAVRNIAIRLNEMGIVTRYGNQFENRTIEYILTNPVYTGKLRKNIHGHDKSDRFHQSPDNIVIDGKHQAVISPELFQQANNRLLENKKKYIRNSRHNDTDFMLRGLVRCSVCGATLVQAVRGKSLQCHKYSKGQCNVSHSILTETLNEAVIDTLETDIGNIEEIKSKNISENEKNILLRSVVSYIVFDRKNSAIQIKYHNLF